jgi:hypothetical protein
MIHLASPTLLVPAYLANRPRAWRHVDAAADTSLEGISNGIRQIEERFPGSVPNLHTIDDIFITSDYSGPRRDSSTKYEVFSYLLFSYPHAEQWQSRRLALRKASLGNRSVSFKGLNDRIKRAALPEFLAAADSIPGLLITFAVSKTHRSLFHRGGRIDMREPDLEQYRHWNADAFEKLLRVVHFLTFLVAGLSTEGQRIIWYTDEDDIAPNSNREDRSRTRELGAIWTKVISHYLPHRIRQVVLGTEKDDEPTKSLSDLIAIPDLACGAWCEFLTGVPAGDFINAAPTIDVTLPRLSDRALTLLAWFVREDQPLRRLLCVIDEPLPENKLAYMCSAPATLTGFKKKIEAHLAKGAA